LTAERVDKGVKICLLRDGVRSGNLGVAYGDAIWEPDLASGSPVSVKAKWGVDLKATSSATNRNAVEFIVPDEGIEQFVDDLFGGKLKPLELLQKSGELAAQKSARFNFDITSSAVVDVG
ncbi:AvrE-family type 3 secretion system effector, partial [Mesorhizobium japonicum]|uniref:AvrE-family type 3 secretion system effector n=1 Tax=Mesorhizobium japonicum TaxID=2066070 RepID=UPI003B5C7526